MTMLDKWSGTSVNIEYIFWPILQQMKFLANLMSTLIEISKISRLKMIKCECKCEKKHL